MGAMSLQSTLQATEQEHGASVPKKQSPAL